MLQTKALYNLLRLNVQEDPSIPHERWAVEDLRKSSLEDLFSRLTSQGVFLEKELFLQFAEDSDTPEDLAEVLLADSSDPSLHDPLYLLIFEIWRRLIPQKTSLSIFCDELDRLIELYDQNGLGSDEPLQDALANLQEVFDENVDDGVDPKEIFSSIGKFCAHDIEDFLYDYISDVLDSGNPLYASELIDGFFPYIPDPVWFEILKARLVASTDVSEANLLIAQLLKKKLSLSPLLEILNFLATAGDKSLFVSAAKKAIPLLETEEEFQAMLVIVSDYYRLLDLDLLEESVQKIMKKRKSAPEILSPEDPDLHAFAQIIQKQ